MDLVDQLQAIAHRYENAKSHLQTEEATKNAIVMPFIQALGYNVFDPLEVMPELVSDIGTKKGEKVDYAIMRDGKPIIIFECKKCGDDLRINHASQLFRYFHVTEARFAVLTNGLFFRFFTDLEQPNKMDDKPFLEFSLLDFKDTDIAELKKFTKSQFDVDAVIATASELKYTRVIKNVLSSWMDNPSEDFVKLVSSDLIAGRRFTPVLKDQFTEISKRAFQLLISDKINERLKVAMNPYKEVSQIVVVEAPEASVSEFEDKDVVTTSEEIEGFFIVKSILRDLIGSKRVFMRDAQSYCAILLDDNNRKPICRLRFNNPSRLSIGLFNGKDEERIQMNELDDIYNYADRIKATVTSYL